MPLAWVDLGDRTARTDGSGRRRVAFGTAAARVRARADVRASAWVELPPSDRPPLVPLPLVTPELADLRITLRCNPDPTTAHFTLQPRPDGAPLVLASECGPGNAPFVLRVPVGSYHLTLTDIVPGGAFLLPLQFDVDVPPSGVAITRDVAFGGLLSIDVRDGNGTRLAGTRHVARPERPRRDDGHAEARRARGTARRPARCIPSQRGQLARGGPAGGRVHADGAGPRPWQRTAASG